MRPAPDSNDFPPGWRPSISDDQPTAAPDGSTIPPRLVSGPGADDRLDKVSSPQRSQGERAEESPPAPARVAPGALHMAGSTMISLLMVLTLLAAARLLVPSLVESIRYSWHRGQLRAEYELSDQRLNSVSLDSLTDVSQMVSQRLGPSVVHINVLLDDNTLGQLEQYQRYLGRGDLRYRYKGQGSGFVIDESGYILTNHHVVEEDNRIEVTLADGRILPAEVVGFDEKTDIAVLKVEATNLLPIHWGDSDQVAVGTPVWAVGNPYGLQHTVTFGIVSSKHRLDLSQTGQAHGNKMLRDVAYRDLMQSDVAVNPGCSGGPLANGMGQVIGVNAAILGENFLGVSFSIPSNVARRVAEQLIESGEVIRGWLGVRMEDLAYNERYGTDGQMVPGVRIIGFPRDDPSPARQAGIETGDLIIEFNGSPVFSQLELLKMTGETEIGATVEVVVRRDEKRISHLVTVGKRNPRL